MSLTNTKAYLEYAYVFQIPFRNRKERSHNVTPLQIKAQQVKASFADQGIPVSEWADQNGYRRSDVYRVLNGFTACKRGLPHEIAVKLGLKPNPAKTPA